MKKKVAAFILVGVVFAFLISALIGFFVSRELTVEEFEIKNSALEDVTILHLSDIHFPFNVVSTEVILETAMSTNPDFIAISGDIIDEDTVKSDLDNLEIFLHMLASVAPCYAVLGNHEVGTAILDDFLQTCENAGIRVLYNEIVYQMVNGKKIAVAGLNDGRLYNQENLPLSMVSASALVLIAHRPELFSSYSSVDNPARPALVLSGHAHGGAVRLFGQGLYAPNQGLFPTFTNGKYTENGVTMLVSRGLGHGGAGKVRVFNKHHIIVVKGT